MQVDVVFDKALNGPGKDCLYHIQASIGYTDGTFEVWEHLIKVSIFCFCRLF